MDRDRDIPRSSGSVMMPGVWGEQGCPAGRRRGHLRELCLRSRSPQSALLHHPPGGFPVGIPDDLDQGPGQRLAEGRAGDVVW